jgi:hypothetical protein
MVAISSAVMADRYTYVPYIGAFFLIVSGVDALLERKRFRTVTAVAVAVYSLALGVIVNADITPGAGPARAVTHHEKATATRTSMGRLNHASACSVAAGSGSRVTARRRRPAKPTR